MVIVDLGLIAAMALSLGALWALLIVVVWILRPKDVPIGEVLRVTQDALRLLRSVISDPKAPKDVRPVIGIDDFERRWKGRPDGLALLQRALGLV